MSLRVLLVALIVAATAAFVVGVTIERNSGESGHDTHAEATHRVGEAEESHFEAEESHSEAGESAGEPSHSESGEEWRPLGIDVEAWPFVTLAALASLALAAAAWLRLTVSPILLATTAAMLAFAALDVREIFHQLDENEDGLATLAAGVAVLHAAAGAVAVLLATRARGARGAPGTMAA